MYFLAILCLTWHYVIIKSLAWYASALLVFSVRKRDCHRNRGHAVPFSSNEINPHCHSLQDPLFTVHHACLCFWFSFSFVEKLWMSYSQYSEHRGTSSCCYTTHNLYSFSVILFKVHSILVQFLIPLVC